MTCTTLKKRSNIYNLTKYFLAYKFPETPSHLKKIKQINTEILYVPTTYLANNIGYSSNRQFSAQHVRLAHKYTASSIQHTGYLKTIRYMPYVGIYIRQHRALFLYHIRLLKQYYFILYCKSYKTLLFTWYVPNSYLFSTTRVSNGVERTYFYECTTW